MTYAICLEYKSLRLCNNSYICFFTNIHNFILKLIRHMAMLVSDQRVAGTSCSFKQGQRGERLQNHQAGGRPEDGTEQVPGLAEEALGEASGAV